MKTIRLFALAIPAIVLMGVTAAQAAEPPCKDNIAEVQKSWDKMYPMGMDSGKTNYKAVTDNFRIGKELCEKGKGSEAVSYLDVVRGHLNMPVIRASKTDRVPPETMHSDGPSEHHDAKTTPAMGSKPGAAVPTGRDDHHTDAADHNKKTGETK